MLTATVVQMAPLAKACKAKALRESEGEKYYFVCFLGTREDERGKGCAMRRFGIIELW